MRNLLLVAALALTATPAAFAASGETLGVKITVPDTFAANPPRHPSSTFTTLDFVDHTKRLGVSITVDDQRASAGNSADIHEALKSRTATIEATTMYSRAFVGKMPGRIVSGPDGASVAGRFATKLVFRDPSDPNKAINTIYTFLLEGRVVTIVLVHSADAPDADVQLLEGTIKGVEAR